MQTGTVAADVPIDLVSAHFRKTPAHSSFDWHNDATPQYVITLSGALEFTTASGETFTLHPGDVLLAEDNTDAVHRCCLINDQPWRRVCIAFKPGSESHFIEKTNDVWPA